MRTLTERTEEYLEHAELCLEELKSDVRKARRKGLDRLLRGAIEFGLSVAIPAWRAGFSTDHTEIARLLALYSIVDAKGASKEFVSLRRDLRKRTREQAKADHAKELEPLTQKRRKR